MIPSNPKSLFWTAVFIPIVLIFIVSQMGGYNGFLSLLNAARTAGRLLTVQRPSISPYSVQQELRKSATGPDDSRTRIMGVIGLDKPRQNLYATISVGDDLSSAEDENDPPLSDDLLNLQTVSLPSTVLCRFDLRNGQIDWLTSDEYLRGIYWQHSIDPTAHFIAWLSIPVPERDADGRPTQIRFSPDRTFWRYDPLRGRIPIHAGPNLLERFVLSPDGDCASYVSILNFRLRSELVRYAPDDAQLPSEPEWNGFMNSRTQQISSDGETAIGTIRYPKLGRAGYTEFVEHDLTTGEILSTLDQSNIRTVNFSSFRSLSDDSFLVHCNDKVRIGEPFGVISFYRSGPIRHVLDAAGFMCFPTNEAGTFLVLDSSENELFRDRDSEILEGAPVFRYVNMEEKTVLNFELAELLPEAPEIYPYDHLQIAWSSRIHASPVAPDDGTLLLPNREPGNPAALYHPSTGRFGEIHLPHPVLSFLWSPDGQYLALSSTSLDRTRRKADSEMGLNRTEVVVEAPAAPNAPRPDAAPTGAALSNPTMISIWDRHRQSLVDTFQLQGVPVSWREDGELILLQTQFDSRVEPGEQPPLLHRYRPGSGLQPLRSDGN